MDSIGGREKQAISIAAATGRAIAVIGAGPCGLSCAGELTRLGHSVTVFEKRSLAGGLSTYGIIALREPIEASLAEVAMLKTLGVRIETGAELGANLKLEDLQKTVDAVFLGVGLGSTSRLDISGEDAILDGLEFIEQSKLNPEAMKIGKSVAVIGAGNTAIDCATIAKRLGAERVTIIYRRSSQEMTAYPHEFEFIKKEGVEFRFLTQPVRVEMKGDSVVGLTCSAMDLGPPDASGRRSPVFSSAPEFIIEVDQIVKAIGQVKPHLATMLGLTTERGFIRVGEDFQTSVAGVFAGGDCIRAKNSASTVMAVQDGKLAAKAIHRKLTEAKAHG
jgi:glutamate synthase (NADPH/NADH) small chain